MYQLDGLEKSRRVRGYTESKEVLTDKVIKTPNPHGPAIDHPTTFVNYILFFLN